MKINKIQTTVSVPENKQDFATKKRNNIPTVQQAADEVSFKKGADTGKKAWLMLRRLGNQMKENTELQNAAIAAIGTGIIAPAVILVSPGKGDKQDKDKKFLQALRQPISAAFALGFQLPTTLAVTTGINKLVYDKRAKIFKDKYIGDIVPNEKYLIKKVKKSDVKVLEADFEKIVNGKSLKQELEEIIKEDYKQVGLEISDDKLAKKVNKRKNKFLRQKIAKQRYNDLMKQKIKDIINKPNEYKEINEIIKNIKDIDLVTEDIKNVASQKFKDEYVEIEKNAKLSFWDKAVRSMGFENKNLKKLKEEQDKFKKNKGLELLKNDSPELFNDKNLKIKNIIENYQAKANKTLSGKTFWSTLAMNMIMVALSCYALNWAHPRINSYIEAHKAENKKVEVA